MALLDRIQTDMVAAMRAKEEMKLNAIRMIKTALKKHEVDSMKPLDEATELQILGTLIKQRREAADMFRKGDRAELADKEEAELKLIEGYMPAAPSEQEIDNAIVAALAETGGQRVEQLLDGAWRFEESGGLTARMQRVALGQRDHLVDQRLGGFRLGNRGHNVIGDDHAGHQILQQGVARSDVAL